MSSLHHLVYQSYIQRMHQFCQYPRLVRELNEAQFSQRVRVLAIGKAAWKMASLSMKTLAQRGIAAEGIVLTKTGLSHGPILGFDILTGGHPLPDANSLASGEVVAAWLKKIPAGEDLLVLLSGGTSALFELLPPGSDLDQLASQHKRLLASGKDIAAINRERADLSLVKGGKALELAKARKIRIFAVSDVEGNDPWVIGSGPFTPVKPGEQTDFCWSFKLGVQTIEYRIVADNKSFRDQFAGDLSCEGFRVLVEDNFQSCPLPKLADQIKETLRRAHSPRFKLHPPFIRIMGGETPLKVTGKGLGGRCSHLALLLVRYLARYENAALFCLATDGCDNISGSGGAWADSNTHALLKETGISLSLAKKNFDSHVALKAINHLLAAPLLPTNVNDIFVLSVGYNLANPYPSKDQEALDIFDDLA